jgi:hypothetical protein
MILSASRRTDIPAFHTPWLLNRLREGFLLVRNPVNAGLVYRVELDPPLLDAIVFWTKDPVPLLARLPELERYGVPYYFLFTLNPYGPEIEPGLRPKGQIRETFALLSERLGPARVIWRYDPVLMCRGVDEGYHLERFAELAALLSGKTEKCILSFLHPYRKTVRNMQGLELRDPAPAEKAELAGRLRELAARQGIALEICAGGEGLDPEHSGVPAARCIDDALIRRLSGTALQVGKDRSQRAECRCVQSVDVGTYDSCPHLCRYCYANADPGRVWRTLGSCDPASPLLAGVLGASDRVVRRGAGVMRRGAGGKGWRAPGQEELSQGG